MQKTPVTQRGLLPNSLNDFIEIDTEEPSTPSTPIGTYSVQYTFSQDRQAKVRFYRMCTSEQTLTGFRRCTYGQSDKEIWGISHKDPPALFCVYPRSIIESSPCKLRIKERVGKGGYGTVFRASDGGNDVILKTMLRTPSRSTEEVARKEYDFGMKLKHPNIVRMRGSFDTETDHCLIMDVVDGCNLFDHLEKNSFGHFPESKVKKMFKGLARGLEHSHRQGIAHLDIKPENVMVGKADHLTLIDFGLAAETLGLCHQFKGSADYASPEVWRNMPFEPACSDVWSLGIVLHILLTGCLPFDPSEVMDMRVRPDLYWPEFVDVSDDAKELVQWMLELKPLARPTMKEVLNHRWLKRTLSTIVKRRWSLGRVECTDRS
ncbi:NUAK family SNF1-like kinase 1-like [Planoprotostelium fungivorum]|uniref:NUAK family SNF1-like kinase 1-like n=1 Tax=Planoprotostelium fungivorum TaxID=1890364 RepID=A0A2P6NC80_9EUKA|nr:NUAK family SNF1-like kinase 1-like [Planoprotostelium fungivorum]